MTDGRENRPRRLRFAILSLGLILACAAAAKVARADGDIALGEYLAGECVTCHQLSGHPVGAIPAITGWPEELFVSVLQSYRSKERDNKVMQAITSQFSDEDLHALAAYFGSLKKAQPQ